MLYVIININVINIIFRVNIKYLKVEYILLFVLYLWF